MPKPSVRAEVEIKLLVTDVAAARKSLERLDARVVIPRTYELNTLYDTPRQLLRRRGCLIRLRIERPASPSGGKGSVADPAGVLTYKAPFRGLKGTRRTQRGSHRRRFKIRGELELSVSNAGRMTAVLGALGLRPSFRYEKFRTTFAIPRLPGVSVELDETPVGDYWELEGSPTAIDRAAKMLGYARSEYVTATYGALYLADCRRRRRKPGHMLFATTKKLRKHALFS